MAGKSITAMAWLRRTVRNALTGFRRRWLNTVWGMQIGEGCAISWSARLDRTNPRGIVIGRDTAVVFGAAILAHDTTRRLHRTTRIGERCNIIWPIDDAPIRGGITVAITRAVNTDEPHAKLTGSLVHQSGLLTRARKSMGIKRRVAVLCAEARERDAPAGAGRDQLRLSAW